VPENFTVNALGLKFGLDKLFCDYLDDQFLFFCFASLLFLNYLRLGWGPGPLRATSGPGKPLLWGPVTTSFRMRRDGGNVGCPLTIPLGVWGSIISSPGGVRGGAPVENGFMHIWGHKKAIWNSIFGTFERWWAPNVAGPRKTFPPFLPCRQTCWGPKEETKLWDSTEGFYRLVSGDPSSHPPNSVKTLELNVI